MDDEQLLRLARVLPIIPPELTEVELENRMAAAAEREAAGTPVAVSDRDLAAHLALHPDAGEEYAAIVESLREDLSSAPPRPPAPQRRRWAPASGLRRGAEGQQRDAASYERDWPDLLVRTKVRLHVEADAGSIFLELAPLDARELAYAQIMVALASGLSGAPDGAPPQPLETQPLGRRGTALFVELEPRVAYTLTITLADAQELVIDLPADLWPQP